METVVSSTTESALQIAISLVKRQLGYLFNYNDKFEEVKGYVEMLDNTRKRIQHQVNNAEMNAEEIEDEVQHCLKQMDEKITKYEHFIHDEHHSKTRCSIGFFPNNLQLRYRLGRSATKMVEEMKAEELWNKKFDEVSYRVLPSIDAALANTGYESFMSRTKTMDMFMQALEDSTVNMIGVYGVGGVGKTTLVKEVAKKAQEKKLFNVVIMANITRSPNIKKIQGQIAEMLGMRLEEESEIVRADRIRKRLKKEKENTLIILDDLWDGLDLNRLGIPCSDEVDGNQQDVNDISDSGYDKMEKEELSSNFNELVKEKLSDDPKICKILLTSRRKQVLCNQMDVQERSTFSVGVVDENEAKTLLKKVAGIDVQNFVYDEKAIEISRMCNGLPIAIVSIGRALKNKSSSVWEDVYQQIKKQSFIEGHESVEFSIKLSYDHLKNEQLKYIFLHCARMGNDALIMDLVIFCFGLGLLQGVHTIREARNKVNMLIEELKESSLVVDSYSSDRFNMHDIVRDVALSIASKEKHMFFMKNGILDEWPHNDELERYTAIFLHYCHINDDLPGSIYCPRLEVLHIDSKDHFLKIPDDFFKDMIELRVLILTGVNLPCLPSSIICLTKLRMLSLERCTLGQNLSIIAELKKLRILTLSGSDIESFPFEFGQLDKLQLLDLSNCSKLRVIPSNVISRMNILEEFYMRDSLILWEAGEESQNACLSELKHLNQLRNLDIHIQSVAHVPQNLFFDKLDSYKIVIGEFNMLTEGEFKIPDKYEKVKLLVLNLKEGIDIHSETSLKMLFKSVEYLLLGELIDVHDVFYELNVDGFPNLKHLSVVNNFGIQYVINSVERFHPILAFPKLESLYLYKLDNLEKLCNNQLVEASFCRLKLIKIKACDKLENLFPFSMIGLLTMLETIEVCDCDSLKDIVSVERQTHTSSDDKIEFPQLRLLTIKSLPAFTCFYTDDDKMSCAQPLEDKGRNRNKDVITEVEQDGTNSCPSLFNEKVSMPKLEWLELSSVNVKKIWSDQPQHCFQNLITLNVIDCGNLKYLLSFSVAGSLVNLQSLSVKECEMMEDIFHPDDAENNDEIFPKLKKMEIICMDKLNTIWQPHIGLHSFRCLDSLIIRKCHKLVTIFPSFMGQRFQSLQSLTITNCKLVENIFEFANIPQTCDGNEKNLHKIVLEELPNLVSIWKDDTGEIPKYNNLQRIKVAGSPKIKYLFPLSVTNDLEKLKFLDVRNCRTMKNIVAWEKGSNENSITFKFPYLNTLSLQSLFELRSFYGGTHTLEWPLLKKLIIARCGKLEGLTTEISNSQVKPIVLAIEKVIYNLELMAMSLKEAEWFQKYNVNVHRMHKLQSVVLHELKNSEILFWFLRRLPNLKRLSLGFSHLKRIWAPASLISREKIGVVMQLKELELNGVWPLEEIGFEHDVLLQRVGRLIIQGCIKLRNLATSSVSFSYLTYLEVINCKLMRNLMTSSTAKTLVQLQTMKVSSCPKMVEIVAENEDGKVKEIEFKELRSLELISLQNLTSFSNADKCEFKFPLLENLVVSECPQMRKFSEVQSTPNLQKLHAVAAEKDKWYWEGDLNLTLKKHFTYQVSFEYSKHMKLGDYPEMKEVRHGKPVFPDNFFGNLKTLEFDAASKREIAIPSHLLPYLKNLEELSVENCKPARVIFDIDDNETKTKEIVFRLKKLTLKDLSNLTCVWNKDSQGIVSFPNLQEVFVNRCESLVKVFSSTLAKNLGKLKTLDIQNCRKLKEIVEKKEEMEHGTTEMFEFPCLSKLILWSMPQLICFYPGKHHLKCPILEKLHVAHCPKLKLFTSEFHHSLEQQPLFWIEKVFPKLKEVTLNEKNIILLNDRHSPEDLLHNLTYLLLSFEQYYDKNILPFDFLHKVRNLETLIVRRSFSLKEIFPSQKLDGHDEILPGLKTLSLQKLTRLESIGLDHPWVNPYSEKLQVLFLLECPSLDNLVCSTTSFVNLKMLVVKDCKRMQYLFTSSTAKSLFKLETLHIENCETLKEITKKEDQDDCDEIIFGRLTKLRLYSLPRLVSFYSGNATLQFSSLKVVRLCKCPNMKIFCEADVNAPLLYGIKPSTKGSDLTFIHNDLNMTIESLFHEQVFFEYSKHMILVDYLETRGVGPVKPAFPENFFDSLKKMEFDGASKRDTVIPSHVLPHMKSLEELNVHSSDAVQVIFGMDDSEAKTKEIVFHLKKLTLKDLSNLKCVWNRNPQGIVSFSNLQEVFVSDCGDLVTLFPSSLAKNLSKLKILSIEECQKLVEIVGKEDIMELGTTITFEFPCLSWLSLFDLKLLSYFYPGKYHLECPILETLNVANCPKLKLFTSEIHDSHKEAGVEAPISWLQQPLFKVEKVVPKLKRLTLNEENIMLFSDAQVPQDYLCKLNLLVLCFEDDSNEKDTLPFDLFQKIPSLEQLRVQRCFGLKEIFPSQVHDGIPASLNRLFLIELNELESIGFEHPWVKPYSENLQILRVLNCPRLENLGCCAISFINLKELYVSECERMEYLFTYSTAKSLVQLETLVIKNCESIKEITKDEDEDGYDDVIFGRLRTLTMDSLPQLERFYSGNASLRFSCMEKANVSNCPNMKTFSEGVLNAPRFLGIKTSLQDSNLFFHDDLNTTCQKLFQRQVEKSACDVEHLKFGDHPHLEEIWLGAVPIPRNNCFNNLKSFTVVECESLSNVIPFYLLQFLCNLKEIEVSNCSSVKAIFDVKGTGDDMKPVSLPLKKLILNQLPNLEHIWNLNPDEILSLQDLQEVYISNCQSLKSLFPTSVAKNLAKLDVRSCATLVEIFVEAEAILDSKQFNFHCLTSLNLWELPELKYFYGKNILDWPMLTHLDIYHCDKLKLFTTKHHTGEVADVEDQLGISIDQQAIFSVEKVFPNLVQLSLKKEDVMAISQGQFQVMPNLEHQAITSRDTMIGQGQFGANDAHLLQNLKLLKLTCYHEDDESNIFSGRFLEEIPNIEILEVVCSSFHEIFSSQRPSADCTQVLLKLKRLHLKSLQHLISIGFENSWVEPLLKTIETLEVLSCPCMKIVMPSTMSFSNLTSLSVGECDGLVYLFTSSTAKSLAQLKYMSVWHCQAIQEIVSKEGDHESNDEEIAFEQLTVMSLESLPSIVGIYSGTFKLKFPSLNQVNLTECPQMKYSYVPDLHEFKPHEQI